MNKDIANVTPDSEQALDNVKEAKSGSKLNAGKVARGAMLGAGLAASAGTGAAVASAMEPGEIDEEVIDAVEAEEVAPAAAHAAPAHHHAPEAHAPQAYAEADGAEVHADAVLVEPEIEVTIEDDYDLNSDPEVTAPEINPEADNSGDDFAYIAQPDMDHIDVQIDETINYDADC